MKDYLRVEADEFTPLRDVVCKTLRRAILAGKMPPGTRLLEVHLADEMGVSRTPIREAIRVLEQEGLVIMRPRRGAEVAKITVPQMRDVLELRTVLDVLAVELACERATDEDIKEIEKAAREFEQAVYDGDLHKYDVYVANAAEKFSLLTYPSNLDKKAEYALFPYQFVRGASWDGPKAIWAEMQIPATITYDGDSESKLGGVVGYASNLPMWGTVSGTAGE